MAVTPGIRFIFLTAIPALFGPPVLIHALLELGSRYLPLLRPTPVLLAFLYLVSAPAHLVISNRVCRLKNARAARRLGVHIAPSVEGVLPGNIDLIYRGMSADKDEYLGEPWLRAMKDRGSTFTVKVFKTERFCTSDPRNVQKVLATEFEHYHKGNFTRIMEPMLGSGVFNSDGDVWQFHRKMTRPFLSKERVTDLQLYERKTNIALQRMQDRMDGGFAVDFQDLVSRFTMDSAAEFLLGASINSLDSPLPYPYSVPASRETFAETASTRFAAAFMRAQVTLLTRVEMSDLWPLAEIFEDKMKKPMEEIRSFIDPIVRNAIARRNPDGADKDGETLLAHLVTITDNMRLIVDETLNMMLAGRDSTASLLTFATYALATHPRVFARLREEVIATVGSVRAPSYDDIREMKYLRAVLNETLRLFPPVPFNVRETRNDTTWVDVDGRKVYLPANTRVNLSILHLHRNEAYWGTDAHVFDPDRWLDSRIRRYTANPFIFVPFNAGPRICLGQQLAYNEASFFLVQLLRRFARIELASECQPPKTRPPLSWANEAMAPLLGMRRPLERCFPRAHLTLYADGGLWIRATQAEEP